MEQITYSTVGDYQMPNLTVDKEIPLGKYAMMKKKYLKEQQPEILFSLRVRNQLNSYLMKTEKKANEMMEMLMKELLTKNPAPNKEIHQMEWVQHMNNLQKTAEEINSEGNNLQLDLGIEEVDKEKGGDNVLPPFDLSDLPQLLREDVHCNIAKKKLFSIFMSIQMKLEGQII
mgnify:CR=1 FL=1